MGTPETHLTMCDLCVTHFTCARNSLFNTMYTTTAMPSIIPSNFCNLSIFFSDQKNIFQKSHYFGRGYPYQAIAQKQNTYRNPIVQWTYLHMNKIHTLLVNKQYLVFFNFFSCFFPIVQFFFNICSKKYLYRLAA